MNASRRTTLVTGASGGIGLHIAQVAAESGDDLVLVARREQVLEQVAADIRDRHGVGAQVVALDLTEPDAARRLAGELAARSIEVDMLVNNAGLGTVGDFLRQSPQQARAMVDLNVTSLVLLTRELLPGMVARGNGRILNVASTSAFQPGPGMAVYHASKAFVLWFSDALAHELRGTGVTVTTLCPRMTESGFFEAGGIPRTRTLERILADPRDVALAGYRGALKGRRTVIPGASNKVLAYGSSALPRRLVTSITARVLAQAHPRQVD